MLKFMHVITGLSIGLSLIGCGILKTAIGTNQSWSRNYARLQGTTATAPEMIDGDYRTTGKTTFPEGASAAMGISAFSEAVIQLPEKKSIHRIVIHSDKLQQFDIMVNNAGVPQQNMPMTEVSEETFDQIFHVNVKSIYWSALYAIPELRKRGPQMEPPRGQLPAHQPAARPRCGALFGSQRFQ